MTIAVGILVCLLVGIFRFGWLQHNRFSLDEWVESGRRNDLENRVRELETMEANYQYIVEEKRKLEKLCEHYRFQLNARPKAKSAQSLPEETRQPKRELPQNIMDAYSIVQQWFLDVDQENHPNVSKHTLTENGMNANRQREAWNLLTVLDIAGRAGTGDNAKRILIIDDQNEINHIMQVHIEKIMRDGNGYVQS